VNTGSEYAAGDTKAARMKLGLLLWKPGLLPDVALGALGKAWIGTLTEQTCAQFAWFDN
jgi:hypothetical protein